MVVSMSPPISRMRFFDVVASFGESDIFLSLQCPHLKKVRESAGARQHSKQHLAPRKTSNGLVRYTRIGKRFREASEMSFVLEERQALLELKGVGPVVIQRFEEIGISSFEELSQYTAADIADRVADMLGSSCWKNSTQSKGAIQAAIDLAQRSS